jgi:hypothetical protein
MNQTDQELRKIAEELIETINYAIYTGKVIDHAGLIKPELLKALTQVRDAHLPPAIGVDMSHEWHREKEKLKKDLKTARKSLRSIANHRKLCREMWEDCSEPDGYFDEEHIEMIEQEASRCLKEIGGGE